MSVRGSGAVMEPIALSSFRTGNADALMGRLRAGDRAAVAEVYDLHHEVIRSFGYRMMGDAQQAEDLVHEVFVELPNLMRRFRGDAALRTFLLGIAANRSRHVIRKHGRRAKAVDRLARCEAPLPPRGPEEEVLRRELGEVLRQAITRLPLDQRTAFVLREVEERSAVEVAQILDVPQATVRTRVFHAKRKLRAMLQEMRP